MPTYDKRETSASVSVVYVTAVKTHTPVLSVYAIYNPWLDKSSKFEGYTYGTCTHPQHMLPETHSANPSKDARYMGPTCIYPISYTTRTTQVDHHNREASLAYEIPEQPTVLAVTVTSFVDETRIPSVSPEDISDHPTGRLTGDESLPTPAVSPEGFGFDELPFEPRNNHVTTGLGFMPKISFAPRPTEASLWLTFDAITIPPAQDLPSFLTHRPTTTHHPISSAMPTLVSGPNWSPNPFAETYDLDWTLGYPEPDTTTTTPNATTTELLSLISDFTPTTDKGPPTFALLEYESKRVSLELANWEEGKATVVPPLQASTLAPPQPTTALATSPAEALTTIPSVTITIARHGTLARRDALVGHGSSFATLSKEASNKATTGAIPVDSGPLGSQTQPEANDVRPNSWRAISSSGERRIKGLYADGAMNGCVVAALVIGLGVLGGAVVSAVEDIREIVDGVGIGVL